MRFTGQVSMIVAAWLVLTGLLTAEERRPNIVIILADDLGYGDLGCQGCDDVPTPHIDSIARDVVRFTDGYATHPVCSPSRAGLMSGMYQHRFGFEHNSGPERYAAPNFGLPRTVPTLAEKLQTAGYATGMVGKWHIGFQEGLRPHERGFDESFVFLSGARSYLADPAERNPLYRNGVAVPEDTAYLTDAFARESVDFIERSKNRPFFLYLAFNAVHSPLEATSEYEKRFPQISERKRKTYAGMLSAMDDAVGRVLTKVRDIGAEENTLIFFYSDNGGPTPETTSRNDPLRGFKGQMFEGGIRIPFLVQWKGTIPAGQTYSEMVMGFDCHATALAAAGFVVPPSGGPRPAEARTTNLDGVNLLPYLTGEKEGRPHEQLFWRGGPQHAARVGDWKLVNSPRDGAMLFNLKDDIGEQHDLAATNPAKLGELQAAFADWEKGTQPAKWIRQDQRNAEIGGKLKPESEWTRAPRQGRVGRITGGLYRRRDGPRAHWECVYRWPWPARRGGADEAFLMRGLTAVPAPDGDGEVLLGSRAQPGVIERIDPRAEYAVTVELDLRDHFMSVWKLPDYRRAALSAYNTMTPWTNLRSGEQVHLIGVAVLHPTLADTPPHNGAWYLVRHSAVVHPQGQPSQLSIAELYTFVIRLV